MSGWLILFVAATAICALNSYIAYRWSRLDHNPWAGKFGHGNFSGPVPGWNPGKLTVEEIRARGRTNMIVGPIVFAVVTLAATLIIGLRLLIVGHL